MIVVYTILAILVFFTVTDICQVALIKKKPEPQIRYPTKPTKEEPEQKEEPEIAYVNECRCVCCNAPIPEGRQVCWSCENMYDEEHKKNRGNEIPGFYIN